MHACVIIGSSAIDYESDRWTDLVDRGGLTHISQPFHTLFVAIEREVRRHFLVTNATETKGIKDTTIQAVLESDDVQVLWEDISTNWVEEEQQQLLQMITELYITWDIRRLGPLWKSINNKKKKTVQKSQALRKTLNTTSVHHDV